MSKTDNFRKIAIAGSGKNGISLIKNLLVRNFKVYVYAAFKESLDLIAARLEWAFKGKPDVLKNVVITQDIKDICDADIVLQTQDEKSDLSFFKTLGPMLSPKSVIALNYDGSSITSVASEMPEPQKFVSLNFSRSSKNPLVEVAVSKYTDENILNSLLEFLHSIDKKPVVIKDNVGLITERLERVYINSALNILEKGKGTPFEIDSSVKEIAGFPSGPFEMSDEKGIDMDFKFASLIYEQLGKPAGMKPSDIEHKLFQQGCFGKKSGLGFYIYDDGKKAGQNPVLKRIVNYLGLSEFDGKSVVREILITLIKEAEIMVSEGINLADINTVCKLGFSWKYSPLEFSEKFETLLKENTRKDIWRDAL